MEITDTNKYFKKNSNNKIEIKKEIKEKIKMEFVNALFKLLLDEGKISYEEYKNLISN